MFSQISKIIIIGFFIQCASAEELVYITVGADTISSLNENKIISNVHIKNKNEVSLLAVPKSQILKISSIMHEKHNRCGGFFYYPDLESANESFKKRPIYQDLFSDYSINQESLVEPIIEQVKTEKILKTIEKLSSYFNRYYKSNNGVESQNWLKSYWESIIQNRTDARVELFTHEYPQPSVILTIQGSKNPEDIIVIGGHGDSISGGHGDRKEFNAPGADDNASGIAVITEIIRVLINSNFRPEKTIKFISYAAEEVGLRGSNEIANRMKAAKANVIGVLQFDMTNYQGSEIEITLISDYTNSKQNTFLGKLIDKYVHTTWGYGKCGYACSDHASWNNQGFIASFPFESQMQSYNPNIHTKGDTLDKSKNSAIHATKFAKLGVSYLIELDR